MQTTNQPESPVGGLGCLTATRELVAPSLQHRSGRGLVAQPRDSPREQMAYRHCRRSANNRVGCIARRAPQCDNRGNNRVGNPRTLVLDRIGDVVEELKHYQQVAAQPLQPSDVARPVREMADGRRGPFENHGLAAKPPYERRLEARRGCGARPQLPAHGLDLVAHQSAIVAPERMPRWKELSERELRLDRIAKR